jgi:outer membrane protein OmpA-like peptidoglycan-associated protein
MNTVLRRTGSGRLRARCLGLARRLVWGLLLGAAAAGAEPGAEAPEAINERLYEQLDGGDAGGRIERVSGQLYLSEKNLDAGVIREALVRLLDEREGRGEAVAIQRGPRLNLEIHFEKNSAELTPEARRGLDELGRVLEREYRDQRFLLGGHTDSDGDDAINGPLSQARAESARAYLVERFDLDPERFAARGFGTSEPLRPQERTPRDKLYNRRVDLRPIREAP